MNSRVVIVCFAMLSFVQHHVKAQKSDEQVASAIVSSHQQELATNIGRVNDDVLVLMPTTSLSANSSQGPFDSNNYNLFKLDMDVLNTKAKEAAISPDEVSTSTMEDDQLPSEGLKNGHRSSRKINFLRGMWNKPKISPLYLVNGTVCRFVNSRPICTTLSTTGLLPTNSSAITSGQFGGSGQVRLQGGNQLPYMGNQQFMGNQPVMDNQQQQLPYQNMNPQQQQFLNNQNPSMSRQQPQRPFAALLQDDPTSEVNIGASESSLNETSSSTVSPKVQQAMATTNRPLAGPQRRPALNLLGLRRPLRFANGKAL